MQDKIMPLQNTWPLAVFSQTPSIFVFAVKFLYGYEKSKFVSSSFFLLPCLVFTVDGLNLLINCFNNFI